MNNKVFNYKFLLAHKMSAYPLLYSRISKAMTGKDWFTGKHSNIVIDGFPRCANTYATYAFDIAQDKRLSIAHHIHKKSQFLVAEEYGIPAILLIRNPIDCISSLLIRQPKYEPLTLFKGYYYLYHGLLKHDGYIVAEFKDVLNNYGNLIAKVNLKFAANFNLYVKNEENEERIKQIIHAQEDLIDAGNPLQRVAYPNDEKKNSVKEIKKNLHSTVYKKWSDKCIDVYNEMIKK